MNLNGLLIGFDALLMTGTFHPVVIRSEYYIGEQIWPLFVLFGVAVLVVSLFLRGTVSSALITASDVSCLWSTLELFEQKERVKKG